MENKEIRDFMIKSVTTSSPRAVTVMNILNSLIKENNSAKAKATCAALATYSLQKWAYEGRLNMAQWAISAEELMSIASTYEMILELYDTQQAVNFKAHSQKLEDTEQILFLVEKAVMDLKEYPKEGDKLYEVMTYVHFGCTEKEDLSNFVFGRRYRTAVQIIIKKFGDRFSKIFEKFYTSFDGMAIENQLAYHNTEILLEIYPMLYWNLQGIDSMKDMDENRANTVSRQFLILKMINSAIEEIKNYPMNGDRYYEILKGIIKKNSTEEIRNTVKLSRRIYYGNRKQAIALLSYLLWGYFNRDIISPV